MKLNFKSFYLNGEHVINIFLATRVLHLQCCMHRLIPSLIVRKCYPFVLRGKD